MDLSLFLRNLIAGASTTTAESAAAVGTTSAIISANIQALMSGVMLGSGKG